MLIKFFLPAILFLFLFSFGCFDLIKESPGEKAVKLADQLPEIDVTERLIKSFENSDECTLNVYIENYSSLLQVQGMGYFEPTQEQRKEMGLALNKTKDWVNQCNPRLSRQLEMQSENSYVVYYEMETNKDAVCDVSSEKVKVFVDLREEKAIIEEGSVSQNSIEVLEEVLHYMGPCAGLMFFSLTVIEE